MANNFLKIKNGATLRQQGTVPTNPVNGDIYYDSNQNSFVIYNNGFWMDLTSRVDVAGATNLTSTTLTSSISQATLLRITGTTATNVCGLAASSGGKQIVVYNDTTLSLSLKYQDPTEPVAANRLTNSTSTDIVLKTGQTAVLIYDDIQNVWIVASSPGSGGIDAPTPTKQIFLSGSGTYITPPNVAFISIEMVGGGGGGGGSGNNNPGPGGNGTATTFGTSFLIANGGQGGGSGLGSFGPPPIGGTASFAAGAIGIALKGGDGSVPPEYALPNPAGIGGANSPFGGAGGGAGDDDGTSATPNTGSGGGGAGGANPPVYSGASGAAGGYLDVIIGSPVASYAYTVGTGGTGGPGGSGDGAGGGTGGSGVIIVTEYYYNGLGALAGNGGAYTPTVTTLTSGSGTFTTPVNASYIRVQMVGGGGGGSSGGTGGNTTFGSLLTANAGSSAGGGGYTINAPAVGYGIPGTGGDSTIFVSASEPNYNYLPGGNGANSVFGGAGPGGVDTQGGSNGVPNTGAGGGGGSSNAASLGANSFTSGQGGGAGGYIDAIIVNPSSSYSYTVGDGGSGGSASTYYNAGGNGGSGIIIITTYYNNGAVGTATNITLSGNPGQVLTANSGALPSFQGPITSNYFTGYMSYGSSWTTPSSGVFADPTNTGGNTLTTIFSEGLTVTAESL